MRPRSQGTESAPSGSVLLVVMIVLAVLSVMAAAAITLTGREREASHTMTRAEEVRACAEAARANVMARLRSVGMRPTDIQFSGYLEDGVGSERSLSETGHLPFNTDGGTLTVPSVELVVRGVGAAGTQARDVTNLIGPSVLGGQYYRVTVNCQSRGRQHELEMLVRFGL